MKDTLLHIICLALLCTLLPACSSQDEPVVEPRIAGAVMLNLSVTTRAADPEDLPKDLQLWVYGGTSDVPLFYANYPQMKWVPTGNVEEGTGTVVIYTSQLPVMTEIDADNLKGVKLDADNVVRNANLRVHAVVNAIASGVGGLTIGKNTKESELKAATFTTIKQDIDDNELLMHGSNILNELKLNEYRAVEVNCIRCVSKLELYATKLEGNFSTDGLLKIHEVKLRKMPKLGYVAPQAKLPAFASDGQTEDANVYAPLTLLDDVNGVTIDTELGYDVAPEGFGEAYDADNLIFTPIEIGSPFLSERKGADKWGTVLIDDAYLYYYDAYILTITYDRTSTTTTPSDARYTKHVVLTDIERNWRYRVFLRFKGDSKVEINTARVPWVIGEGKKELDVTSGSEDFEKVTPL